MNAPLPPRWARVDALARALLVLVGTVWLGRLGADHVLYRDEAQALLMARTYPTVSALWDALGYEGSPGLYHSFWWVVQQFTRVEAVHAMVVHVLLCAGSLVLLSQLVSAPWMSVVLFSPACIYLGSHVRSYALSVFLLLLWGVLMKRPQPRGAAVVLALLAHSSIPGWLGAGVLVLHAGWAARALDARVPWAQAAGLVAASILNLWQMRMPADILPSLSQWHAPTSAEDVLAVLQQVLQGSLGGAWPGVLLGLGVLTALALMPASAGPPKTLSPRHLWVPWALLLGVYVVLGVGKFLPVHHLYTVFVATVVLAAQGLRTLELPWTRWSFPAAAACSLLMLPGAWEGYAEALTLHSNAKAVAEFVDRQAPDAPLLTANEIYGNPILLYRQKDAPMWAIQRKAWIRHMVWNHVSVDSRINPWAERVLLSSLLEALRRAGPDVLHAGSVMVLGGFEVANDVEVSSLAVLPVSEAWELRAVACFDKAREENYLVYVVTPRVPAAPAP